MAELANCSRCGAVFVKSFREVCQQCYQAEEEAFKTVYHFLRDKRNRKAGVLEIVEETGVEEALIIKFVKEKRLTPSDFPSLAYPCERCGNNITDGKICSTCSTELQKDLQEFEAAELKLKERNEQDRQSVYFAINKDKP